MQRSQPLVLECSVSGSPAPAAKWLKDGKEVTPGPLHHQQHTNLAFVAVTTSDAGTYACAAQAAQGPVISATYTVNVLGKRRSWMVAVMSRSGRSSRSCPSSPQNLHLLWRVRTTGSSPPAPPLASPAFLRATPPQTSPGCLTLSPSCRRHTAFRSQHPRLLFHT